MHILSRRTLQNFADDNLPEVSVPHLGHGKQDEVHALYHHNRCELYDAYDIEGEYVFNLIKFDSVKRWTLSELTGIQKVDNFVGPFNDAQETAMYFFSAKDAAKFEIDAYEYEEEGDSIEDGHIFVLQTVRDESELTSVDQSRTKTHYRIKRNLGSQLTNIKFGDWKNGEIMLEYGEGDICEGDTRFYTRISFVCDKSEKSLSHVVHIPQNSSSKDRKIIDRMRKLFCLEKSVCMFRVQI